MKNVLSLPIIKLKKMKELTGLPNLVVLGVWNKAIFSIDWMRDNVYKSFNVTEINYEIPFGNVDSSLKFNFENFSVVIVGNRLEFVAKESSAEAFEQIMETSRIIFRLLSHTPVSDFGINHRFQYETDELDFDNNFSLNNTSLADYVKGTFIKNIQKSYRINEIETLTVIVNDEIKEIGFNYNYKINNLLDYFTILKDSNTLINEKKLNAISILENVYNLKL